MSVHALTHPLVALFLYLRSTLSYLKSTVECLMKIIIKLIPWNAIQNILIDVVVLFVFVATQTATLYTLTLLIPFIFLAHF